MNIRDRIKELRRVPAKSLQPHPMNWRKHPHAQRSAVHRLLKEIGYADALLARELPNGDLELIDGHLRADLTPDAEVPILIVDLDDDEAAKLLLLHDPLANLAEADKDATFNLIKQIDVNQREATDILDIMRVRIEPPIEEIPLTYCVAIECKDEAEQQTVYDRMTAEGHTCTLRVL